MATIYDTDLKKEVAAPSLRSKMNHELYNFLTLVPSNTSSALSSHQLRASSSLTNQGHNPTSFQFFHS